MILGIKTLDSHRREVIDLVAAAAGDLFQRANIAKIEKLQKGPRH